MKKKGLFVLAVLVLTSIPVPAIAQVEKKPFVIGEQVKIHSSVLGEDREISIYLPQDYSRSEERFPVLYLLDGEWHFIHTSGIVQFLARPRVGKTPEMMVVAIVNTSRGRDFSPSTWPGFRTYTGGAKNFIRCLVEDIIPFIEKNYRASSTKILAGHSLAGTFTLFTFLTRPEVFDAYMALSPCLFWHNRFMMQKSEAFVEKHGDLEKILFIAHEYTGGEEAATMDEFENLFNKKAPRKLRWTSVLMDKDTHFTYVHKAIYEGLEFIFSGAKD